jgi:hypothetical protein
MESEFWLAVPLFMSAAVLVYLLWPRRTSAHPQRKVTSHRNGQGRHWGE